MTLPRFGRRAPAPSGDVPPSAEGGRFMAGVSWLDVRLGARMLLKHPGMTLAGGVGMAVAIAIGACFFALSYSYLQPTVPLDEGDRVVAIDVQDLAAGYSERRILHDFDTWRRELRSVQDLGAFQSVDRNLAGPDGTLEQVRLAEITASGFHLARVAPALGRPLLAADERPGAPAVVVIGDRVWRTHFGGDPGVVGRTLRLGNAVHTVVGVMPAGFGFPVSHILWTPLRADPADYARRQGPGLTVFGRLAPGATMEQATAELRAIGRRTAADFPDTHQNLRPRVLPYTAAFMDGTPRWALHLVQLLISLLLVVISVNVGILVYARTATRQGEIAVRTALGASRNRIVGQLFVEALVLSALAAGVGLGIAALALRQVDAVLVRELAHFGGVPFWMSFGLSTGAVLYAMGLAVLGAVIVGVVPGLQWTGRRLQAELRHLGGGTGMRMARTWTLLIVAQVALAMAVMPATVMSAWKSVRYAGAEPGFAAASFLTAELDMDQEVPPTASAQAYRRDFDARYAARLAELITRLRAEPSVSTVTFGATLPGQEAEARIEVEGIPTPAGAADEDTGQPGPAGHLVRAGRVDPGYFDALEVPVLAGRGLDAGDLGAGAGVVVSRSFARKVLGDGQAVGRRFRYVAGEGDDAPPAGEAGRWYEVVGVVDDFPAPAAEARAWEPRGTLYHALAPGGAYPANLAVRVRDGAPAAFAGTLRAAVTRLDPALHLSETRAMDEALRQDAGAMRLAALALGAVCLSVILLSAAGIYALMSFTVTQRRREIGIRAALGAPPHRILASVFSRALVQLGAGLAAGIAAAVLLDRASGGEFMHGAGPLLLPAVAAVMAGVGVLATLLPAVRGLRIHPVEALRAE